jgi:alanine racemase
VKECYRCWAEVDLNALRENLAQVRCLAGPDRKVLTVVKADAYGHGLREIAAVLMQSGTDIFGVANLAEARAIRSVGRGWPILMLGACLAAEAELAVREGVMVTLSTLEEARVFSAIATRQRKVAVVHLKIDTGMGRLGVAPDQAAALLEKVEKLPGLAVKGLYTHSLLPSNGAASAALSSSHPPADDASNGSMPATAAPWCSSRRSRATWSASGFWSSEWSLPESGCPEPLRPASFALP